MGRRIQGDHVFLQRQEPSAFLDQQRLILDTQLKRREQTKTDVLQAEELEEKSSKIEDSFQQTPQENSLVGENNELNIIKLKQNLQDQIQVKEIYLKEIINSVKDKLKSNSKLPFDTKRQEREEKLNLLFENLLITSEEFVKGLENIKQGLSKKLTEQEIDNLCQAQIELNNLKQSQQAVQILQPTNQPYGTPGSSK